MDFADPANVVLPGQDVTLRGRYMPHRKDAKQDNPISLYDAEIVGVTGDIPKAYSATEMVKRCGSLTGKVLIVEGTIQSVIEVDGRPSSYVLESNLRVRTLFDGVPQNVLEMVGPEPVEKKIRVAGEVNAILTPFFEMTAVADSEGVFHLPSPERARGFP
jgi:hypothetical protein